MPVYEFECSNCKKIIERTVSINRNVNYTYCPLCGGSAKKIVSHSSFHLKGSGWYKDIKYK